MDWKKIRTSFQPTYEGLKLIDLPLPSREDLRFQPTYEGLKPGSAAVFVHAGKSFQPTYEGLKRDFGVPTALPAIPFSAYL